MLSETISAICWLRLAQSFSHFFASSCSVQVLGELSFLRVFWAMSEMISTNACRRTYISSSNPTHNTAALSMTNRSASEDDKGRGGEIVTIALVPAGGYFSSTDCPAMPHCKSCLPLTFTEICPLMRPQEHVGK